MTQNRRVSFGILLSQVCTQSAWKRPVSAGPSRRHRPRNFGGDCQSLEPSCLFTQPSTNLSSPSTVGLYTATREDYVQPWSYGSRKISLLARINF
jgi:hypothetical protein